MSGLSEQERIDTIYKRYTNFQLFSIQKEIQMAKKKQLTTAGNPLLKQELQRFGVGSDLEGDLSPPPASNFEHSLYNPQIT